MAPKVANVPIAIDASQLRRARIDALAEESLSRTSPASTAKQTLLRLAAASKARGGRRVSRAEMHERS